MKRILILLFLSIPAFYLGQVVPSSCEGTEDIVANYTYDAQDLAIRHLISNQLAYADSVEIPAMISDSILNALIAVYNAVDLPARDSVVVQFPIHTFPLNSLNTVILAANEDVPWMVDLMNNELITSDATLNQIISDYGLLISNQFNIGASSIIVFYSEVNYNMIALSNMLEGIPEASYSEPDGYVGDGNNIHVELTPEYTRLIYSHGWGDCPAGCIYRWCWDFRVYPDCSVEFVDSYDCYGVSIGIPEIKQNDVSLYPNPVSDVLNITNLKSDITFEIFDVYGQTVRKGITDTGTISDLSNLSPGLYIIALGTGSQKATFRVIKN